jgi:hypothetical protein
MGGSMGEDIGDVCEVGKAMGESADESTGQAPAPRMSRTLRVQFMQYHPICAE